MWLYDSPLVLASGSAIRRAVLEDAGIPVETIPADLDERAVEAQSGIEPNAVAALLAREKARKVAASLPGRVILGADQILALGARRVSEPHGPARGRAPLPAVPRPTPELPAAAAPVRH